MALKDNDYLETGISMKTIFGGNGDYYIQIWCKDENGLNKFEGIRIAISGGQATPEIKNAIAKLHWAMEEAGLNEFPE